MHKKVTVLGLCVCVCLCQAIQATQATRWRVSDTNSFRAITSEEIKDNFSEMGVFKSYGMKTSEKPICIISLGLPL